MLSQILNEMELSTNDGSALFRKQLKVDLKAMKIKILDTQNVVALNEKVMNLDKAMELSGRDQDIYANGVAHVDTPHTLGEKLLQTDFSGIIQIISILANIFGLLIAYVGYRKGCASATTAAMALENLGKAKAQIISVVTEKVPDEFLEDLIGIILNL